MHNHLNNVVEIWEADPNPEKKQFKLFLFRAPAGFPSPAEDYIESSLDLNEYIVTRPATTYFARLAGDSLIDLGVLDGDVVAFDRSITASHNQLVMCTFMNEITAKVLYAKNNKVMLCPANDQYKPIYVNNPDDLIILGPITAIIRKLIQ